MVALVAYLALGCAVTPRPPPMPTPEVGRTSRPYAGLPFYLQAGYGRTHESKVADDRLAVAGEEGEAPERTARALPMGPRLDRVRSLLAAVDTQLVALPERVDRAGLEELALALEELDELLEPFTDITWEVRELEEIVARLPDLPPAQQVAARRRMGELTDLIRLQLLAGR